MTRNQILVDWIQYTYKQDQAPEEALAFIKQNFSDFTLLSKGALGYKKQAIFSGVKVFWDGSLGMGTHVQVPGKACRYLESQDIDLFKLVPDLAGLEKVQMTRLDLALDIEADPISRLVASIDQDLYISKARNIKYITSKQGEELKVETIYIGSRQSTVMLRVYDKALEQKTEDGKPWTRIECEIKKDYIPMVASQLSNSINLTVKNLIWTYFRPLERKEKNISRSPVAKYWLDILGECERIKHFSDPRAPTIGDKKEWFLEQCAKTYALLWEEYGPGIEKDILVEGRKKIKEKDLSLLSKFKEL